MFAEAGIGAIAVHFGHRIAVQTKIDLIPGRSVNIRSADPIADADICNFAAAAIVNGVVQNGGADIIAVLQVGEAELIAIADNDLVFLIVAAVTFPVSRRKNPGAELIRRNCLKVIADHLVQHGLIGAVNRSTGF